MRAVMPEVQHIVGYRNLVGQVREVVVRAVVACAEPSRTAAVSNSATGSGVCRCEHREPGSDDVA